MLMFSLYLSFEQGDKARVIQTLLFMSAINTLLQTFFGSRLPTVMNPSFAYMLPVSSIINDYSNRTFKSEHEVCSITLVYFLNFHITISFWNYANYLNDCRDLRSQWERFKDPLLYLPSSTSSLAIVEHGEAVQSIIIILRLMVWVQTWCVPLGLQLFVS